MNSKLVVLIGMGFIIIISGVIFLLNNSIFLSNPPIRGPTSLPAVEVRSYQGKDL